MLTGTQLGCQVAPCRNRKGRPQPPLSVSSFGDYRVTTAFSWAIMDAMVSSIPSMLRPVSVAAST
jgi:hypothetical protein